MTSDAFTSAESTAAFVLSQTDVATEIGLVLGSGLGAFADDLVRSGSHSLCADSFVPAVDGCGSCRTVGDWKVGRCAGRGDAGAGASV